MATHFKKQNGSVITEVYSFMFENAHGEFVKTIQVRGINVSGCFYYTEETIPVRPENMKAIAQTIEAYVSRAEQMLNPVIARQISQNCLNRGFKQGSF